MSHKAYIQSPGPAKEPYRSFEDMRASPMVAFHSNCDFTSNNKEEVTTEEKGRGHQTHMHTDITDFKLNRPRGRFSAKAHSVDYSTYQGVIQ
jgi:hypothetical protein